MTTWTNIADTGDIVALVKDLKPLFGLNQAPPLAFRRFTVDNGVHAHDVRPYLSAQVTGEAIAEGVLA